MARRKYKRAATSPPDAKHEVTVAIATPTAPTAQEVPAGPVAPPSPSAHAQAEENPLLRQLRATEQAPAAQLEAYIESLPLSDHKKRFLKTHPHFFHPVLAQALSRHHHDAIAHGLKEDSPEIDSYILANVHADMQRAQAAAQALPAPAPAPPAAQARRGPPVSAPPSRETPAFGGGNTRPGEVTPSPAEREAARIAGISDTQYARNKIRLLEEKSRGRYMEPS